MTGARGAKTGFVVAAIAWLAALPAAAQIPQTFPTPTGTAIIRGDTAFISTPIYSFTIPAQRLDLPPASMRPIPQLTVEQQAKLLEARALYERGQVTEARATLQALNGQIPHHPIVLAWLARILAERGEFPALERMARSERSAMKDSLLLGHDLVLALERLGKPRDAAIVALEVWAASNAEAEWAAGSLLRLAPTSPKAIREAARRTAEKLPDRADLGMGVARLEWAHGDEKSALRMLALADRPQLRPPLHWTFAEELVRSGSSRDSTGAISSLVDLVSDPRYDFSFRMMSARRAWELAHARGGEREFAPRLQLAMRDVPPAKWPPELLIGVVRGLREAGLTSEARALLTSQTPEASGRPELALERALSELRDGPSLQALQSLASVSAGSPEAGYRYAEALFYFGLGDSAKAVYQKVAADPAGRFAGAALERIYLIEEANPPAAIPVLGRIAYLEWRGDSKAALALTDSLYRSIPRGPSWAQAAIKLAAGREAAGDYKAALEPLVALADSLPGDRLAPLARQRIGDLYATRLKNEAAAAQQYEECLARYPRAWNAAEVRRKLEALRRERRF